MRKMEVLNKYVSDSKYYARTWDREDAYRYVFKFGDDVIEAGFFIHYKNDLLVKYVVELSSSFGCPVGCLHCASGGIYNYRKLSSEEIVLMYDFLVLDNSVNSQVKLLITFSGIGEGALQSKEVFGASKLIFSKNESACFNFSTVGFNPKFLALCDRVSQVLPVNYIQVTYIHYEKEEFLKVVPSKYGSAFDFSSLVLGIEKTSSKVRLNFVMMSGVNDQKSHWEEFCKRMLPLLDKVIIRVSKLNPTEYSKKNGIKEPELKRLEMLDVYLKNKGFESHIFTPLKNNNMNCGQLIWSY